MLLLDQVIQKLCLRSCARAASSPGRAGQPGGCNGEWKYMALFTQSLNLQADLIY